MSATKRVQNCDLDNRRKSDRTDCGGRAVIGGTSVRLNFDRSSAVLVAVLSHLESIICIVYSIYVVYSIYSIYLPFGVNYLCSSESHGESPGMVGGQSGIGRREIPLLLQNIYCVINTVFHNTQSTTS